MKLILMALVSLGISAAVTVAEDDKLKAEQALFEGTWQLASAVNDGKETPDETVKKIKVVIKDGKHTVYFGEEAVAKEIPFKLDISTDPKRVVDTLPDGKEIKGIYKLEKDTLTSCVAEPGKDYPKEFSGKAGTGTTLRVFKKVKT